MSTKVISNLLKDDKGYNFGYVNDTIKYEDLLYVDKNSKPEDDSTWEYTTDEEEKELGKSATDHPRVKFLDPAKYGGKYTKPKVYIEDVKHNGWLGFLDSIVPEEDGYDPKRENFLFLSEVADRVNDRQTSLENDGRFDLEQDCISEPAFDKLMSSPQKAQMEGIIIATIRTYVVEAIIRSLPIFSKLQMDFDKNYSNLYVDFLSLKMEEDISEREDWPSSIRGKKYWYLFCDSAVDLVFRLVKEEEIDPTPILIDLLEQANEVTKDYLNPIEYDRKLLFKVKRFIRNDGNIVDLEFKKNIEANSFRKKRVIRLIEALFYDAYGGEYRSYISGKKKTDMVWNLKFKKAVSMKYVKRITREYDLFLANNLSRRILSFLIKKELNKYKQRVTDALTIKPEIEDLNKWLLRESEVFLNTEENIFDISKNRQTNPLDNLSFTGDEFNKIKNTGGFFLEKYFSATPKEGVELEGLKSVEETKLFLTSHSDKEKYISELFGDAKVVKNKLQGSIGLKFGVRISYVPPSNTQSVSPKISSYNKNRAIYLNKASPTVDGVTTLWNGSDKYIPIISYEQDILDRKIKEFDLSSDTLGEDIECYLDKLSDSEEFNFFFNKLMITNKLTSLLAIYNYTSFIESIGMSESEREEGILGSKGRWKEKILKNTRSVLADMFSSCYYSNDKKLEFTNEDTKRKAKKRFKKNIMPKLRKNLDKSVKFKQLRRMIDRPFDKFGNEKVSVIAELLGD